MSDMANIFKELKSQKQEKRRKNREQSALLLQEKGIEFDSRNCGAHLIIEAKQGRIIDFWPGTGLWRYRDDNRNGRGVHSLIKELGQGYGID